MVLANSNRAERRRTQRQHQPGVRCVFQNAEIHSEGDLPGAVELRTVVNQRRRD